MLKDLFYNVENQNLDLARVLAFLTFLFVNGLAAYQVVKGLEITPEDLANANLLVLVGTGLVVGGKDLSRSVSMNLGKKQDYYPSYGYRGEYDEGLNVRMGNEKPTM